MDIQAEHNKSAEEIQKIIEAWEKIKASQQSYFYSDKGKAARKKANKKYYEKHRKTGRPVGRPKKQTAISK